MRIFEVCTRHPVVTILVMGFVLLTSSLGNHRAASADEAPTIAVIVQYPGASADTMAAAVAAPLERRFVTIPGITSIASSSADGRTEITIEFEQQRTRDVAATDLQFAISAVSASLPQDLPTPVIV